MKPAVVIDDLVAPRLSPLQRQILDHLEQRPVDLDPDALIRKAVQRTGLRDFGRDDFRARLAAQVAAIEADTGNTNLNRLTLRNRIIRLLSSRLLLTDLLARYPEIHTIEIDKPIIVVGLPRSGTTYLVNLIAADARRRALPYWESQEPFPLRGEGPDAAGIDPRYARCLAEHDMVQRTAPYTGAMHDRHPSAIEEEVELLDIDFAGYVLEWHARVP
ncbi:MAG: sulfotransferase, partial [Mycobacteriaceae bacterium]|nr:sulfotransferase [Mycobacteriaceae bacterium]